VDHATTCDTNAKLVRVALEKNIEDMRRQDADFLALTNTAAAYQASLAGAERKLLQAEAKLSEFQGEHTRCRAQLATAETSLVSERQALVGEKARAQTAANACSVSLLESSQACKASLQQSRDAHAKALAAEVAAATLPLEEEVTLIEEAFQECSASVKILQGSVQAANESLNECHVGLAQARSHHSRALLEANATRVQCATDLETAAARHADVVQTCLADVKAARGSKTLEECTRVQADIKASVDQILTLEAGARQTYFDRLKQKSLDFSACMDHLAVMQEGWKHALANSSSNLVTAQTFLGNLNALHELQSATEVHLEACGAALEAARVATVEGVEAGLASCRAHAQNLTLQLEGKEQALLALEQELTAELQAYASGREKLLEEAQEAHAREMSHAAAQHKTALSAKETALEKLEGELHAARKEADECTLKLIEALVWGCLL
jgi:hypothetical protein